MLDAALAQADDPAREVLVARIEGAGTAWWPFAEDVDADLPAPEVTVSASRVDGGVRVVVTARTYVRDLSICWPIGCTRTLSSMTCW